MALAQFIFTSYLAASLAVIHPLKMTTSKLTILIGSNKAELVSNFFYDDFKSHLFSAYQTDIKALQKEDLEVIEHYIRQNFTVSISNQTHSLHVISASFPDENVLQIRMELSDLPANFQSIQIINTLLLDAFPKEQENIVHLVNGDNTEILHFSAQETIQIIKL